MIDLGFWTRIGAAALATVVVASLLAAVLR